MVKVQSQNDGDKFQASVHAELLCFYSPYYTVAIHGRFLESKQDTFILELDYTAAKMFVSWLYTGSVDDTSVEYTCDQLHALYMFAHKTDMLALRRWVISDLYDWEYHPENWDAVDVEKLCLQLPDHCGLKRFLLDSAIADWESDCSICKDTTSAWIRTVYPQNFASEVIEGFADRQARRLGGEKVADLFSKASGPCNYHDHEDLKEWAQSKYTLYVVN